MNNDNIVIGNRIKELLKQQGKSQIELADHCGVTPQTVYRWCSGKLAPRAAMVEKIAEYLHTNSLYLLGESDLSVPINQLMDMEIQFESDHPEWFQESRKRDLLIRYIELCGYDTSPFNEEYSTAASVIPDIEEYIDLKCNKYLKKKKGETK